MTSLFLILPSTVQCLEEDEQEESNCSGSLHGDFFHTLVKDVKSLKISLCLSPKHECLEQIVQIRKGILFCCRVYI